MLNTLLGKMQSLKQGQWLVLLGVLVVFAASGVDLGIIPVVADAYTTHLFYLGDLLVVAGVALMTHRHFREHPDVPHVVPETEDTVQMVQVLGIRHHTLLDHHPRSFYETDSAGALVFVNREYARITERAVSELKGNNWAVTVHPDDRNRVMQEWRNAIKYHRRFECEYTLVSSSGEEILVRNLAAPMSIGEQPFGWMGNVESIEYDEEDMGYEE